ncbi:MAG TPA: response regulator transcription factor [Gaiellaceae bacterium]|nr:response regulator transcription factor [Gaiellaceae bacterium]
MTGQMSCGSPGCGPILVVDDEPTVRSVVAEHLERGGWDVREAADGESALEAAEHERPAGVVLDVRLPGISGWEVCRELRSRFGDSVAVLFVSGERVESMDRVAGFLLGGDDYLVKPFALSELLARLDRAVRRVPGDGGSSPLTRRELDVLRLLAEGRRQPEIARELVISQKTVGTHIEHILGKLGVHSRAQAVALAYRNRLIAP